MILALIAAALQPTTVLSVPVEHALIEGVATDGKTIWLSSLIDRKILACESECETLATLPDGLHPFAVAWDSSRKRIWVAADCPPGVPFIRACERGALIGLDARGRIETRIAPGSGAFHPGDVSVADGHVIVSDSQNGAIYRLTANAQALFPLVPAGVGKSGQGTVIDASGTRAIVADYGQGIAAVDLATGARTLLPRDIGRPLRGIDGLARCGDTYLAIYNGQAPGTLVTFKMAGETITAKEADPDFTLPDPTQLVVDGERLLLVANSGWAEAINRAPRTEETRILGIPLAAICGLTASSGQ